ncbi:MAG: T9SS type A sorting domain-containing protein [Flavobacteriaceae bacterium]|nr:T9SS type A sorting domain-containing protein [Flavobacteriaceae bacterium]
MKKHLYFYRILLSIPLIALLFFSFSSGAPNAGVTGSPGDGFDCTACHTGADTFTAYNLALNIQTNIPSGGYTLGQTYTITVSQTYSGAIEHGFQITAENSVASKVGTFVITDALHTQVQNSGAFVTHTKAGNDIASWSFNWVAPSIDSGVITFYVASIAGNPNSSGGTTTTNSQMTKATLTVGGVLAVNNNQLLNFSMYPNPSDGQVTLQLPSDVNQAQVDIFDYLGKTRIKKSVNASNSTIDISNLNKGIYFMRIQTDSKIGTKKLIVR